jgi:L-Ala-D/L-Glu epimerase
LIRKNYLEKMEIEFIPYSLELKYNFNISYSSRKSTPIVLVMLKQDGVCGYGEASLPPYLPENTNSVISFLKKIELHDVSSREDVAGQIKTIDEVEPGNTAAKASIDIALHDLLGKLQEKKCSELYEIDDIQLPLTSYTIGIDTEDVLKQKIIEAEPYKILKIKLGTDHDREIVNLVRSLTDKPLYVDANQGWNERQSALELIEWLALKNVVLVEQPLSKENLEDAAWLKEKSSLPIIADEAFQRFSDLEKIKDSYEGINIKLMKCTGIMEAYRIILRAKELKLKTMLGCMTETSCAVSAAIQLSSLVDYADLDGNQLISNDPFESETVSNGRLLMPKGNGLGIKLKDDVFSREL